MATVKIYQKGKLIWHTRKGKGIFFKITKQKGKVFSSESLTNNSKASKKSAVTRSE
jgi:hypothetical protein